MDVIYGWHSSCHKISSSTMRMCQFVKSSQKVMVLRDPRSLFAHRSHVTCLVLTPTTIWSGSRDKRVVRQDIILQQGNVTLLHQDEEDWMWLTFRGRGKESWRCHEDRDLIYPWIFSLLQQHEGRHSWTIEASGGLWPLGDMSCTVYVVYRGGLKFRSQVWWILFLPLLTTSAWACLQHSRNLGAAFFTPAR